MKPSEAFQAHRAAIRRIVERHRARNVRVFGSVLHGDDVEGGYLDLLVDEMVQDVVIRNFLELPIADSLS
jgi:predicted nucleotidyltransferase